MKYYIGLDIGTSSVGWAVTDERYNLVRRKGKDMWGVRLFDEAKTAAERRTFRTSRRRLQREKARIGYLKELFAPEINKKDPGFFQRLDDSFFYQEDKHEKQPYALFADTGYTDKDYYEEYPTIFHLRKELVESSEPHDVRLVYLAVLNMFKHRGHFLNPNLKEGEEGSVTDALDHLKIAIFEQFERDFSLSDDPAEIEAILADRSISATVKTERICALAGIGKKEKFEKEIWKLICGLKGTLSVIFENDNFTEENEKYSISFRDGSYEEKEIEIEGMLSSESYELFQQIKLVHDASFLASVMKSTDGDSYEYISQAKVTSYEKHAKDLKILKEVYRTYLPDLYDGMFRVMKDNNYSAYVGSVNSFEVIKQGNNKNKVRRGGHKSADFFKNVEKDIKRIDDYNDIESCKYIVDEIGKGTFLPKQLTTDNGVIPNQVHKKELRKILENAEGYLPFLKEKNEYGLTASERILELFSFRLPYYVGPLKGDESSVSWVVKKEGGRIYPWNLTEKIDEKATSEKFIENLVNHCTYLSDEKVLPKSSLLYEQFMVLNELNNLKVHGEKISVELKQDIYRDLFRNKGKRVTNKALVNYLKSKAILDANENEDALEGYDKTLGGFTNTLSNYHKFMEVFDVPVLSDRQIEIAEGVIFYSTVYGDSKSFLKERIKELYGDELSDAQIKRITGYKFKDWGNLSKEFLTLSGVDKGTGEVKTLIGWMWDENVNLNQLLSEERYTFFETVQEKAKTLEKSLSEITHDDLNEMYISAPVRRMVWQTIRIVQEIEKVMGCEPEHIFIEVTRREDKKERTVSRKAALQALYKGCSEDEKYLAEGIASRDEKDFRIKKLYLYYRQKGRCMYSGEIIPLDKLFDDNFYDIDHIYPRHYVKDDSIENNLVLVKAELNRDKTDQFPISQDIRQKRAGMWKSLKDGGFITEEKYKRLTRSTSFSEDELIGFVNRQLVETGQGTKVAAQILTQVLSGGKANDKVIYSKAANVSEFRNEYDFIKCRSINDFHHAQDAYLNIVVGNTYYTKFTKNARNFFKNRRRSDQSDGNSHYNLGKMFNFKVERGDVLAWDPDKDMATVRKVMAKNTPIVTKRTYEVYGGISDQQIVGADKIKKANGVGYIPVTENDSRLADTQKYGGFSKVSGAYFFLVEHTKKGKRIRTIENLPVYLSERFSGKEGLETYCRECLGLLEPDVRYEKIRMYSLMKVNGFYGYLTGRSGNDLLFCNAVQLVLPKYASYIKEVTKAAENKYDDEYLILKQKRILENKNKKNNKRKKSKEICITAEMNLALYDELLEKHRNGIYSKRRNPIGSKLADGREKFMSLGLSKQCYVLSQILSVSQLVNQGVDLQDIGAGANSGKSQFNKEIKRLTECKLILQSVTGLYEQEIDLLTV